MIDLPLDDVLGCAPYHVFPQAYQAYSGGLIACVSFRSMPWHILLSLSPRTLRRLVHPSLWFGKGSTR